MFYKRCPNCSVRLAKNSSFCGSCGYRLNTELKEVFNKKRWRFNQVIISIAGLGLIISVFLPWAKGGLFSSSSNAFFLQGKEIYSHRAMAKSCVCACNFLEYFTWFIGLVRYLALVIYCSTALMRMPHFLLNWSLFRMVKTLLATKMLANSPLKTPWQQLYICAKVPRKGYYSWTVVDAGYKI